MHARPQLTVAVIYTHHLLGEGIARLLADQDGVAVVGVEATDPGTVRGALNPAPDVVILERDAAPRDLDLAARLPRAVIVDAGTGSVLALPGRGAPARARDLLAALQERPVAHGGAVRPV